MENISDKDELSPQEELDFEVIPRAINVIVGQGSGLNWPVDAVHSVPPLTGAQVPSKSDRAAEQAKPSNGAEHVASETPSQQPESANDQRQMERRSK